MLLERPCDNGIVLFKSFNMAVCIVLDTAVQRITGLDTGAK